VLVCPPGAMAAQLDRLVGLIGLSNVALGVVPLGAQMTTTPKHGFWIYDEKRVVVETVNTELQLESGDDVELYGRLWDRLHKDATYGPQAHRLITRARAALPLV
jgi:Domain of unknown function (DUF5753)